MYISDKALIMLQEGYLAQYEKLSITDILDSNSNNNLKELLFAMGSFDVNSSFFEDPISHDEIEKACVISSGYILSQSTIDKWLASINGKDAVCPLTREPLLERFGKAKKPYVMLPDIDQLITCFKLLRQYVKHQQARDVCMLQEEECMSIAGVSLIAGKGSLELIVEFHDSAHVLFDEKLLDFFVKLLFSYSLTLEEDNDAAQDSPAFERYWWPLTSKKYVLKFCFPVTDAMPVVRRTFSDFHLNQLVKICAKILDLPVASRDLPLAKDFFLSRIQQDQRAEILTNVASSMPQLLELIRCFVGFTNRAASQLQYEVCNLAEKTQPLKLISLSAASYFPIKQAEADSVLLSKKARLL